MRTLILTMLLATAATPALADPGDNQGHWKRDGSGEKVRPQRAESAPKAAPPAQAPRMVVSRGAPQAQVRAEGQPGANAAAPFQGRVGPRGANGGAFAGSPYRGDPRAGAGFQGRPPRPDGVNPRNGSPVVRSLDGEARYTNGAPTRAYDNRRNDGGLQFRRVDRNGGQRWNGDRGGNSRWSNNWRNDRRYDWRDYRNQNRQVFRLGRYYDPFGYGYQRLNIGFTLFSGYYQSNYWLNDPYQYRLPPAYGPYRWVRYYDDAVLVDIDTGEVVDVIQGFFW